MNQHRKSPSRSKASVITVFVLLIALIIAGGIWAFSTFKADIDAAPVPETISTETAQPTAEITAGKEFSLQYTEPEVKTEKIPVVVEEEKKQIPSTPAKLPQEPKVTEPAPVEPPVKPAPVDNSAMAWANSVMAKYGYWANPMTQWHFAPTLPPECPGDACVRTVSKSDTGEVVSIDLYMKTGMLIEYLLIHEVAHTNGIMNECAADAKAAEVMGTTEGQGYYNCPR